MRLTHLSLRDFRSYTEVELALDPGVSALVGPNGQGKTNLVEAVGYLATLSSHRVAADAPLVRLGAERAVVRGNVTRGSRAMLVEVEISPGKANRARVNRSPVPRPRDVLGILRTVLFAPEDLAMVKGDLRTLEVWDSNLATTGAELLVARLELVDALRPLVDKAYDAVADSGGPAALDYRCSLGDDVPLVADRDMLTGALLNAISELRKNELDRGVSLVGPHRDDLLLKLGPMPAKGYASHGESWSFALALRLAAYDLLSSDTDDDGEPVLILDDVFAELDSQRRERLAGMVAGAEQVLVTAAVPDDVPEALAGARVDVMDGEVRRVR